MQTQQDSASSEAAAQAAKSQLSGLEERLASVTAQLSAAKSEVTTIKAAASKQLGQLSGALAAAQNAAKQAQADMQASDSRHNGDQFLAVYGAATVKEVLL